MIRATLGIGLCLLVPIHAQDRTKSAGEKSGIAARINDEIITWDEVAAQLKDFKNKEITDELRRDILRQLAEERLFKQEAKRNKITVTDEEIDQSVQRVVRMLGDEDRYEEWRRWRKVTKEQHRDELRKEILEVRLYRYLIQKSFVGSDVPLMVEFISPSEIRDFYEKHKENYKPVRQAMIWRIGLQFTGDAEKVFKKRFAESLLRKLDEGTDFYLLARFHSEVRTQDEPGHNYPGFKELKPDNEYFTRETNKVLFEVLEAGKYSGIIEDGKTLNIFFLEQRIDRKEETFEEAQVKIRTELEHRKREANRKTLRDVILKRAYVWPEDLFKRD